MVVGVQLAAGPSAAQAIQVTTARHLRLGQQVESLAAALGWQPSAREDALQFLLQKSQEAGQAVSPAQHLSAVQRTGELRELKAVLTDFQWLSSRPSLVGR